MDVRDLYNSALSGGQTGLIGSSAAQGASDFSNGWFGGQDFLVPGITAIDKMFDLKGTQAARNQFLGQMALNQQAQAYNSSEAEKQRQWEEQMSATEMQRRVKDLEAAGLNPWLALGSLGGAGTGSGSSASTSPGSADMANNKITAAAGLIAVVLRMIFAKH